MAWLASAALLVLGFVFLAREAEITEPLRIRLKIRATLGRGRRPVRYPVARFLDAMLDCSPCVSAWASGPSVALLWLIQRLGDIAGGVVILFVACPVGAVGLLYGLTLVSPMQAVAVLGGLLVKKDGKAKKSTDNPG